MRELFEVQSPVRIASLTVASMFRRAASLTPDARRLDRRILAALAESALSVLSIVVVVLTAADVHWVEALFGFDPDASDQSFEWLVVAVFVASTLLFGVRGWIDWRTRAAARTTLRGERSSA